MPETKKKKKYNTAICTSDVAVVLGELLNCSQMEGKFIYEAVCGVIFHELAMQRPFKILGVGTLTPRLIDNHRHYHLPAREFKVSPKWVRVHFKMGTDLKKEYRKTFPYIDEENEDLI